MGLTCWAVVLWLLDEMLDMGVAPSCGMNSPSGFARGLALPSVDRRNANGKTCVSPRFDNEFALLFGSNMHAWPAGAWRRGAGDDLARHRMVPRGTALTVAS